MAEFVRALAHFTIDIANEVGAGAKVLDQLRDNDVNLVAVWGYATVSGKAKLEIVPDDAEGFIAAAKAIGIAHASPLTVFYQTGADRVGALADAVDRLAAAGVGLDAVQAVSDGKGDFGAVFFVGAADIQRAATALNAQ